MPQQRSNATRFQESERAGRAVQGSEYDHVLRNCSKDRETLVAGLAESADRLSHDVRKNRRPEYLRNGPDNLHALKFLAENIPEVTDQQLHTVLRQLRAEARNTAQFGRVNAEDRAVLDAGGTTAETNKLLSVGIFGAGISELKADASRGASGRSLAAAANALLDDFRTDPSVPKEARQGLEQFARDAARTRRAAPGLVESLDRIEKSLKALGPTLKEKHSSILQSSATTLCQLRLPAGFTLSSLRWSKARNRGKTAGIMRPASARFVGPTRHRTLATTPSQKSS